MKTKKAMIGLLALSLGALASSCASAEGGDTPASLNVDSIRNAFTYLSNVRNVTLEYYTTTEAGGRGLSYDIVYADDYVYSNEYNAQWGYVEGSEGVYPISYDDGVILPGEVLLDEEGGKVTSLWDSDLFDYFGGIEASHLPDTLGSFDLTNKLDIMGALDLMGLERTRYLDVEYARITMEEASLTSFSLSIKLGTPIYVCEVKAVGAGSTLVEAFIDNGGKPFTPADELQQMRSLFQADNYKRDVLNYDTYASEGTEFFNPEYFYGDYDSAASYGLMCLKNQTLTSGGTTYELNGCYYFTIQNGAVNPSLGQPYNSSTDLAEVYDYIHDPLLFTGFEHVSKSDDGIYSTSNYDIVADFAENNQVYDTIIEAGSDVYRLDFKLEFWDSAEAQVTFDIYYGISESNLYYLRYLFFGFGQSRVSAVESFLDEYFPNR